MSGVEDLKIAHGADLAGILEMCANPRVSGLTTNPTPMHKASVKDYEAFARKLLERVIDQPISFEVLPTTSRPRSIRVAASRPWGKNVHVKIPVTNTKRRGDRAQ